MTAIYVTFWMITTVNISSETRRKSLGNKISLDFLGTSGQNSTRMVGIQTVSIPTYLAPES